MSNASRLPKPATRPNCGKPLKQQLPNIHRKVNVAQSNRLRSGKKVGDEGNCLKWEIRSQAPKLATQEHGEGSTTVRRTT